MQLLVRQGQFIGNFRFVPGFIRVEIRVNLNIKLGLLSIRIGRKIITDATCRSRGRRGTLRYGSPKIGPFQCYIRTPLHLFLGKNWSGTNPKKEMKDKDFFYKSQWNVITFSISGCKLYSTGHVFAVCSRIFRFFASITFGR